MKVSHRQLDNGVDSLVIALPDATSVTVQVLTRVGSRYENNNEHGVTHFLEHMCFKGTEHISGKELVRRIESLGAETNAFTGKEYTGYYIKGAHRHWKTFLKLVTDIYRYPAFPDKDIEIEKGVVQGEIDMYADNPMSVVGDVFTELIFQKDHQLGATILGTHESVDAINRDLLISYHERFYTGANTVVMISGKVDEEEVHQAISEAYELLPDGKRDVPSSAMFNDTQREISLARPIDQSHVIVGFPGVARDHRDRFALRIAMHILGGGMSSRLFQKVREEMGAGYYISASAQSSTDYGVLAIRYGTKQERIIEVRNAIVAEIDRLQKDLTDTEVSDAHEAIMGMTDISLETTDAWADWYGFQLILDNTYQHLDAYEKQIRATTREDIIRVINEYLVPEKMYSTVVGPEEIIF